VSAIYGLRALLRRLAVVSLCLLAVGCSSLSGQGYLFTQDSKPLQLAEDVTLKQGHMRLEFNPDPWLLGRLRLHDALRLQNLGVFRRLRRQLLLHRQPGQRSGLRHPGALAGDPHGNRRA
jgi:hypothetical protein